VAGLLVLLSCRKDDLSASLLPDRPAADDQDRGMDEVPRYSRRAYFPDDLGT